MDEPIHAPHLASISIAADSFPRSDVYPFCLEVLRKTPQITLSAPVSFFVGENGSGKSTLLKAVAQRCGIYIWRGIDRTRYAPNPYEEQLFKYLQVTWRDGYVPGSFFASEMFRNFSQLLDDWASSDPGLLQYFGSHSLMSQSHGQGHMAFFRSRFARRGLYLLDEPENALSPRSQLELLRILESATPAGDCQFLIATHSPILLSLQGAQLLSFDAVPITPVNYRQTDHFRVYKDFFSHL
ncbi:MAG: AAA family ATPase [Spirochaetales bacterium]|nr:AAA family ATPase [Spirochaetales bacterium]